jgi:hypothetical protein
MFRAFVPTTGAESTYIGSLRSYAARYGRRLPSLSLQVMELRDGPKGEHRSRQDSQCIGGRRSRKKGLYGINWEAEDFRGSDLIGTKEEAEAELRRIQRHGKTPTSFNGVRKI